MTNKVISIENQQGPFQDLFHRIMRMVPDRDKNDKNLQGSITSLLMKKY